MKINKKIIVSSMALCMGAALAGSVSGTIAWYQYSTRSTVAMVGTSVGVTKNLQVKVGNGDWKSDLKIADITTYLNSSANNGNKGDKLVPITAGAQAKDADLGTLYQNPLYQHAGMTSWVAATAADYVTLPISVRYQKVEGNTTTYEDVDIYLHNVTIAKGKAPTANTKSDISDAVRVSVSAGTKYAQISKNGGEVETFGKLDLNNDGDDDTTAHYEWETGTEIVYGEENSKEVTYKAGEAADESDLYANDETNGTVTTGKSFGKTGTTTDGLAFTVKIWLQGWQKLGAQGSEEQLWNVANYHEATFNVGLTFTCSK